MITVSLNNDYAETLAAMPDHVREALSDKANTLAAALQARVQEKLSGTVLHARSGALARSIIATIDEASTSVTVRITAGGDIKYAAIHEFGGTIPPHQILPDKARALAFLVDGKQAFAARVNLPAVTMPERSYMRSSLGEMADEIGESLTAAVLEAVR
jgi:phage gpG-like protein